MKYLRSLRFRLAMSYLIIILVTLIITDIALVGVMRTYFHSNIRDTLYAQLAVATDTYERYFSENTLVENIANDEDAFWRQFEGVVQIIDLDKEVILDSSGNRPKGPLAMMDVDAALAGGRGFTIFVQEESGERVLAASMPIRSRGSIEGALRFITSLGGVERSMRVIIMYLTIFGFLVLLITTLISNVLGLRFIRPIEKLTKTAEIMATGNYNVVSIKMHEDEIGKLSDTLNHMSSEIKKKEALKNDFISSVSHELRTPLTAIKGWAVTIKDPSTDRELLTQGLDIISEESDRLKSMVDELLDFSKFVSGKITLAKEEVDLEGLFCYLRNHMEDRARREKKHFVVETESAMGKIFADPNRLKQVFINLLDNAFKFTKEGGHVTLSLKRTKGAVFFMVKDDGEGISKEDVVKVKEKFYKGKTSNSSNGIGLSICDEIALLHGGELLIESTVGEGTVVTLRLPLGGK